MNEFLYALLAAVVYAGLGVGLLYVGFLLVDALTPGRLADHVWKNHSKNAAVLVAATFLGLGINVYLAIMANGEAGLTSGIAYTAAFGLLGVALQALTFVLLNKLSTDHLRQMSMEADFNFAILVPAAAQIAVSLIVGASIS